MDVDNNVHDRYIFEEQFFVRLESELYMIIYFGISKMGTKHPKSPKVRY